MKFSSLSQSLKELAPGDHLCCLYKTEEEHRAVLTPFMRQGLEQGEKVIYIVDAGNAEFVIRYLRNNGLDVESYLAKGQLGIFTSDEAYMRDGVFDPDGTIEVLCVETERALDEGYKALRVTGEMTWALRGLPGSDQLIEYEEKLNEFFPESKCLAICQYDRRRFDPALLLDVLATHPLAVVGMEVTNNFYNMPSRDSEDQGKAEKKLRDLLDDLVDRKGSDKEIDRLFNLSIDMLCVAGLDGYFKRLNPAFERTLGYSHKELLERPFLEFIHPEDRALSIGEMEKLATGEPTVNVENRYLCKDGSYKWISWTATPLVEEGLLYAVGRDVSEKKQTQKMLHTRTEKGHK